MFIDTHCHLNLEPFDADRADVIERAHAAGVAVIINPAIDVPTSQQAIELAQQYAGVYAQVGVHPNDTGAFAAATIAELTALAAHPKVVAIGEIGLDYYWERVPHAQQWAAFEAQLELAARLDLPVVIHCRDAHNDLRDILRKWVTGAQKQRGNHAMLGVLHAYAGDLALAEEVFSWNMVLSFGGPLTFRNAKPLQALLAQLPLDRLMLETDAPYLTPHPHRGQRNEPAYIPLIAQGLADIQGVDIATIAHSTTQLAETVFAKLALERHN